jgi:hypothetical protein
MMRQDRNARVTRALFERRENEFGFLEALGPIWKIEDPTRVPQAQFSYRRFRRVLQFFRSWSCG